MAIDDRKGKLKKIKKTLRAYNGRATFRELFEATAFEGITETIFWSYLEDLKENEIISYPIVDSTNKSNLEITLDEMTCVEKGYVGETFTIAKLMRDFNIVSIKVPGQFFSYDLITNNNKRLEVKTAILRHAEEKRTNRSPFHDKWSFRRNRRQMNKEASDFVVCVCFKQKDFSDEKPYCFIIPSETLEENSEVVMITANPTKDGRKYWEYRDKWELIAQENKRLEFSI